MSTYQTEAPPGVDRIVVFDTNAYRNLTYGLDAEQSRQAARELADKESKCSTKALANVFVIWELVSHLADRDDDAYGICMNALVALVEHTRIPEDNSGGVCRMADGETEICRQLYNKIPRIADQNGTNLCALASYVWKESPTLDDQSAQRNFRAFAVEMDKKESDWLDHIESILKGFRSLDSDLTDRQRKKNEMKRRREFINSKEFLRLMAAGKAVRCAKLLNLNLSAENLEAATNRMQEVFKASLTMMQRTIGVWFDAPDMNLRSPKMKRGNFIWDTALCYAVGINHQIGDARICLITDDQAISCAAVDSGCADLVIKLDDYVSSI